MRYSVNYDKIKKELGWKQLIGFDQGLDLTIDCNLSNQEWFKKIQNKKDYKKWINLKYNKN